jgi:DNA-binding response OmpR family regulator
MDVSAGARILIVEDEEKVAFFLKEGLSDLENGYTVFSAPSAEAALEALDSNHFDLVIADFRLPGRNGLELISELRSSHPHTVTMLITAYGSDELEKAAYRQNVARYLAKPFRLTKFVQVVQEVLSPNLSTT